MRLTTTQRSAGAGPLAHVHMAEDERRAAEHYLELGERVADCIIVAMAAVSSALHAVERRLRTLAGSGSAN